MSSTSRRVFLSCAALGLVIILCISLILLAGAVVLILSPQLSSYLEGFGDAGNSPTAELEGTSENVPEEVLAEMAQIEQEMVSLRGLEADGEISREILSPEELRQNVIDDFFAEYTPEDARAETIEMAAFGLVDLDFDLYNLYLELYSEQVAGYYDDEIEAMFIVQGSSFGGPERITYAHEYTHALQDDNFDFDDVLNVDEDACEADSERCFAIRSLIEGDATLAEMQWISIHGTSEDIEELMDFYNSLQMPVFDSAPPALKESFTFPYEAGQAFVQYLYDQDGWESVTAAYQNPPVSTEQIIHPRRYPEDVPVRVTLPDLAAVLGSGWEEIDQSVMGEFGLQIILSQGIDEHARLDEETSNAAAEGWGGDAYAVYHNPELEQTVMAIQIVWDTENDAREFADHFQAYAGLRFGEAAAGEPTSWSSSAGHTLFEISGQETIWVFAPDAATAKSVLAAFDTQ